jgi:TolB protein
MNTYWPRFSPDGAEISFHSEQVGNRNIWVVPSEGGTSRQITKSDPWSIDAQWSPDGEWIAYHEFDGKHCSIWKVSSATGQPINLTGPSTYQAYPRWSPDGARIAFFSRRSGVGGIWIISADGGDPEQLTTDTQEDWFNGGGDIWAKGGRWVYFRSNRSGENRFWRIPLSGGEAEPLTPPEGWDEQLSSDGQTIFFAWKEDGAVNLYSVSSDGGPPRQLTDLEGRSGGFGGLMSTDDEYLYFTWDETFGDIWVMDVESSN